MNETLTDLPTVIKAVNRALRVQNGVSQILEQEIEISVSDLLDNVTFTATNYGVITVNNGDIDWSVKNIQKVILTDNTIFTFTDPKGATHLSLEVIQDGIGGHTMAWPINVDWTEGTAPGSGAANKTIIVTFLYNGSRYRGQFSSYFT